MSNYNEQLTLIAQTYIKDALLQEKAVETKRTVFCESGNVFAQNALIAKQSGLNLECVVKLWAADYKGEKLAEFAGTRYKVNRKDDYGDEVMLTLEELKGAVADG